MAQVRRTRSCARCCGRPPVKRQSSTDRFEAEVWLTDMSRRLERQVKDPAERIKILKLVHLEAQRADLAPELVLAVIETESNFDRYAISVAGPLA